MSKEYGYCRISTSKQNIERQERNIKDKFPNAVIIKEVYTGTKLQGRKELDKLLKVVKNGDTVIFDSVSRMSRDAEEGFRLYEELYQKGINLVFIKEPHINTDTYTNAFNTQISMTGDNVDIILQAINEYLMVLAQKQIQIAFEQAEKEVKDLRQRTIEGMETARLNGKQIGLPTGRKLITKKSVKAKDIIKKHNRAFGGSLTDAETWKLAEITKTTFYKYKKALKNDI